MRALFCAVVLVVAACQAPEGESDAGPEPCAAQNELDEGVTPIVENHRACIVDEDCTTLNANIVTCPEQAPDGIGRCSLIVSEADRDAAAAELAALHEDLCANEDVTCIDSIDCAFVQPVCRNEICVGDS